MAEKLLKQNSWCFLWHIQVGHSVRLICLLPVKVFMQLSRSAALIASWLTELWNDFAAPAGEWMKLRLTGKFSVNYIGESMLNWSLTG